MLWWLAACSAEDPAISEELETIEGPVTWSLEFDAQAKSAGKTDCTYTRRYVGEEDRSVPWLCPSCDRAYRVTVGMSLQDQDCYGQIAHDRPEPLEWLGVGDGNFWRALRENEPLAPNGIAELADGAIGVDQEFGWQTLPDISGQYKLTLSGRLTRDIGTGDPWHGHRPPEVYTCGWIDRHPPQYDGPWRLAVGDIVPDGAFLDRCNEAVRLQQFAGTWLVVVVSAMNCGPCQAMAQDENAWAERHHGEVQVVTLLSPDLSDVYQPAFRSDIDNWADSFGLDSAVLRDRGWGMLMDSEYYPLTYGYPMTVVVGPDSRVRDVWLGYEHDAPGGSWVRVDDVVAGG